MDNLAVYLLALAALSPLSAHALRRPGTSDALQDLAAFPKYEIHFLNELPIAATDAERCRRHGVAREDDFLEPRPGLAKTLSSGDSDVTNPSSSSGSGSSSSSSGSSSSSPGGDDGTGPGLELVPIHYTPPGSPPDTTPHDYLCALPSSNTTAAQTLRAREPHSEEEPDPVQSWLALSHLDNQCLYAHQGWFTYAYCHNSHIRQFRAAAHTHPHPPEGYVPQEDPMYDAYTLGKARPIKVGKAALPPGQAARRGLAAGGAAQVAQADAHGHGYAANAAAAHDVEPEQTATFGVSSASRYLVQRWTDGTRCDKTGRPREIEVQVHCSMTSADMIYLVKELAICQYVVVIHSPHLCSLPGFHAESTQDIVPAPIRCREIINDEDFARWERGEDAPVAVGAGESPAGDSVENIDVGTGTADPARIVLRLPDRPPKITDQHIPVPKDASAHESAPNIFLDGIDDPDLVEFVAKSIHALLDGAFGADKADPRPGPDHGDSDAKVDTDNVDSDAAVPVKEELVLLSWDDDEDDGDSLLIDAAIQLPQGAERRRAFLDRLQQFLEQELGDDFDDGKDRVETTEDREHREGEGGGQLDGQEGGQGDRQEILVEPRDEL